MAATGDMLGWAMERFSNSEGRISIFVLTELTLEYFRLVDRHVLPLVEGAWTHRIVATGFASPPPRRLAAGDDPNFPFQGAPQPATSDNWNHSWTALGERDAYEALRYVYARSAPGRPRLGRVSGRDQCAVRVRSLIQITEARRWRPAR
jgi:hypothetical protein